MKWNQSTAKAAIETVLDIADYIDVRSNDPWDDDLWPAAHRVLQMMVGELHAEADAMKAELQRMQQAKP